jgi:hypothetical protein
LGPNELGFLPEDGDGVQSPNVIFKKNIRAIDNVLSLDEVIIYGVWIGNRIY